MINFGLILLTLSFVAPKSDYSHLGHSARSHSYGATHVRLARTTGLSITQRLILGKGLSAAKQYSIALDGHGNDIGESRITWNHIMNLLQGHLKMVENLSCHLIIVPVLVYGFKYHAEQNFTWYRF